MKCNNAIVRNLSVYCSISGAYTAFAEAYRSFKKSILLASLESHQLIQPIYEPYLKSLKECKKQLIENHVIRGLMYCRFLACVEMSSPCRKMPKARLLKE